MTRCNVLKTKEKMYKRLNTGGTLKILLILLLLPCSAHALFQEIYLGYKSSERLGEVKLSKDFAKLDYSIAKNKFDWTLNVGSDYSDSFLQNLFSFSSQKTIKTTNKVSVSKSSYKYGTISVEHFQTIYDLSNWTTSSIRSFDSETVFEARNVVKYSYEFLNETNDLDWEIIHLQLKTDLLGNKIEVDKDKLEFFTAYISAKHKVFLDQLYNEFKVEAQKRVNLIRSRVRDGLSRKVELEQAKLSLMNQEEQIIKNMAELRESVATLEEVIKKEIAPEQYHKVTWNHRESNAFIFLSKQAKYNELAYLKLLNEIGLKSVDKLDESISHSLNLSLGYTKNAFNEAQSEALSDVFGSSRNDEKIISLTYSIPLGISKQSAVDNKVYYTHMRNKLALSNKEGELKVQTKVLKENVKRFEAGIELSERKIATAQKIVKENQRLYLRGQSSFEEVLRADENLINTRISKINMLFLYEANLAKVAYLTGDIEQYLSSYQD